MNYEELAIDPHNLDEEWLNQPMLFARACQAVEDAARSKNEADIDLNNALCDIRSMIASDPVKYDLKEKPTVGAIQDATDKDERIRKAKSLLSTLSLHLESAKNYLRAVEMKKKSLEGMNQLFQCQYFAVPNMNKAIEGGKRFEEQVQDSITNEHREKLADSKRKRRTVEPPTSQEERDSKTDEEKKENMSPKGREALEEVLKEQEKDEPPKRRRRNRK